jgi:hypothetical protein
VSDKKPSQRGAQAAEIARLTAALERIAKLAEVAPTSDETQAWSALGGIKYVASTAIAAAEIHERATTGVDRRHWTEQNTSVFSGDSNA